MNPPNGLTGKALFNQILNLSQQQSQPTRDRIDQAQVSAVDRIAREWESKFGKWLNEEVTNYNTSLDTIARSMYMIGKEHPFYPETLKDRIVWLNNMIRKLWLPRTQGNMYGRIYAFNPADTSLQIIGINDDPNVRKMTLGQNNFVINRLGSFADNVRRARAYNDFQLVKALIRDPVFIGIINTEGKLLYKDRSEYVEDLNKYSFVKDLTVPFEFVDQLGQINLQEKSDPKFYRREGPLIPTEEYLELWIKNVQDLVRTYRLTKCEPATVRHFYEYALLTFPYSFIPFLRNRLLVCSDVIGQAYLENVHVMIEGKYTELTLNDNIDGYSTKPLQEVRFDTRELTVDPTFYSNDKSRRFSVLSIQYRVDAPESWLPTLIYILNSPSYAFISNRGEFVKALIYKPYMILNNIKTEEEMDSVLMSISEQVKNTILYSNMKETHAKERMEFNEFVEMELQSIINSGVGAAREMRNQSFTPELSAIYKNVKSITRSEVRQIRDYLMGPDRFTYIYVESVESLNRYIRLYVALFNELLAFRKSGCVNATDPFDGVAISDIPDNEHIRLRNGVCWSIESLIEYVRGADGKITTTKIKYPTKTLWDVEYDEPMIMRHPVAIREKFRQYMKAKREASRVEDISVDTITRLRNAAQMAHAKGPYFRERSKEFLTPAEADYFFRVLRGDTENIRMVADKDMRNTLDYKIRDQMKMIGLNELFNYYEALSEEEKQAILSFEKDFLKQLKSCMKLEFCVMGMGATMLSLSNEIARAKGLPEKTWEFGEQG